MLINFINKNSLLLPRFNDAKVIIKKDDIVKALVVNTHKGNIWKNNEDRVSVILNAHKKMKNVSRSSHNTLNNCNIFSLFDGHGGSSCCDFLKKNLH